MLHSLLNLKLAAMVAALGLNTAEWSNPSPEMTAQVQKLADAMTSISSGQSAQTGDAVNATIKEIKTLADTKNDKDAQFAVGLFLQQSNQQGAMEQALEYYKKAADQNQLQAMNNLGFILAASGREASRTKEGVEWIQKAADKGLNAARRNMAQIHLRGLAGFKADPKAAEALLLKASSEKDAQAKFELAQFYLGGGGKENQSDDKAWTLLNESAALGNPGALASLGSVLLDGKKLGEKEIKADPAAAVKKFEELAAQKNATGLRIMGELHESGRAGVAKDFPKALEYYRQAAQGNDAVAQVRLAAFYDKGVDIDKDDKKIDVAPNAAAALELYRLAAQNNVPLAIYNVGTFYEEGRTVDKDPAKAFAFFLQSAVNGLAYGMQKTGAYYLNGSGTIKDPVAAAGWFARAAAAGLPEGLLSYGLLAEQGLVVDPGKGSPYQAAASSYLQAADSPAAGDAVRMESLLRLGSLHFRGLMVPVGETVKPDLEAAYVFFKQAQEIDPKNEVAKEAMAAVTNPTNGLTQEKVQKAEATIARMKADREARKAKAQAEAAAPAVTPPAATPVGAPATAPAAGGARKPGAR
jgi:TPR repeat protein